MDRDGISARRRAWGVLGGALAGGAVLLLPAPAGLSDEAWKVAAIAVVMVIWWVGNVLPRAVTSLLPLLAFGPMGVLPMGQTAVAYAHPLLFLMLGGFVMGHAMEKAGLHERLTAWVLKPDWVRAGPRRVVAVLMLVTAGFSGIVSNTATVLMMLPLALAVAQAIDDKPERRAGFALALAYAASIGGMTTLIGTPPNAVLAGMAPDFAGSEVGFARWMLIGVPAALLMLPLAWWAVAVSTYDMPRQFSREVAAPKMPAARPGERWVAGVIVVAMLAWLTRGDKALGWVTIPGWGGFFPGKGFELDAGVALLAATALFVVPGVKTSDGGRRTLLTWNEAEGAIPWSVILLLGGGFALAKGISTTGLTQWVAGGVSSLEGVPTVAKLFAVCLTMTFVTELTSNTATAQIVLPILGDAAPVVGVAPLAWMVPATLSASCAFMMPVATAPNAIVAEGGNVDTKRMMQAGIRLNLLGAVVLTGIGWLWVPVVFGG